MKTRVNKPASEVSDAFSTWKLKSSGMNVKDYERNRQGLEFKSESEMKDEAVDCCNLFNYVTGIPQTGRGGKLG